MLKNTNHQKITISVIGARHATAKVEQNAHEIGKIVANVGAVLVCGGLSGVIEAAASGAKEAGGLTIGLLPGKDKRDANPYIDIALPTTIGFARNACVACSGDVIIALPGSYGTTSEICYGLVYDKPVIDMGNWKIKGMTKVKGLKGLDIWLKRYIRKMRKGTGHARIA